MDLVVVKSRIEEILNGMAEGFLYLSVLIEYV